MKTSQTLQALKQQIVNHLLKQNRKATNESGCSYRNKEGLKCAVGCLIPDECYEKEIEGALILATKNHPVLSRVLRCSGIQIEQPGILTMLGEAQFIHDNTEPDQWPKLLEDFLQKDYGVKYGG